MGACIPAPNVELLAALQAQDVNYDSAWRALLVTKRGNEYATRLRNGTPVHPTRDSADYALGLLDSGEHWRSQRAMELLWRLVEAQDVNPSSATYGLWSWYYDEPLDQMAAPDLNWADFIGVRLVQVQLRHANALAGRDPALAAAVRAALGHAGRSIMRRDVELSYTNIAIMGCYVTVMAGTLLDDAELAAYGRDRLRRFADFTDAYGGFPEYNSPVYTGVAITELSRMLRDFARTDDLVLVHRLHDRAWEEAAVRWHGPSGQWAGPHRRSYATLLTPDREELGLLQRGLGKRATVTTSVPGPSLDHWCVPFRCPDRLVPYFTDRVPDRDVVAAVSEESAQVTALTRLRPGYALGVASSGSLWMQGRPVVAYAPGAGGPAAWRPRLTYDGRDFAPARIFTAVEGATVLAAICAASDVGAHHPALDHEWTGRVRAADIRLRLELLGIGRDALPEKLDFGETCRIAFGRAGALGLRVLDAGFAAQKPRIAVTGIDGGSAVDVVLYSGEERTFELADEQPFFAAMAFSLADHEDEPADLTLAQVTKTTGAIELRLGAGTSTAAVKVPTEPRSAAELDALATAAVAARSH